MRFVDEFRDHEAARALLARIHADLVGEVSVMEVCGGQTHTLLRYGIDALLPRGVTLIHGPGCPVCVTAIELIDRALAVARRPEVIFTTFGDMMRVPGSGEDLLAVKATGADIRVVYSPLDAVRLAREHPDRQVVFFAVGFETTAPATAVAVKQARALALSNLSFLCAHVRVPPAVEAILAARDNQVQGLIAAGHVCTVMGFWEYEPIATRYRVPVVVTGFEPLDLLQGISMLVAALARGGCEVENQYRRSVTREGNVVAQRLLEEVFVPTDRPWRGIGVIPQGGLSLRPSFADLDAVSRFDVGAIVAQESSECRAGEVLQGRLRPRDCPAFAQSCTPEHPLGAPMVSAEGACAAYYRYARDRNV